MQAPFHKLAPIVEGQAIFPGQEMTASKVNDFADKGGRDRILGLDLARAQALLGMILFHFLLVMAADPYKPAWMGALARALEGRAAATFVVLAGVGITLLTARATAAGDRQSIVAARGRLTRRGLFLLAIGFFNLAIWPGDILRVYGVSLVLAAWLFDARSRWLLGTAAFFFLGFVLLLGMLDYGENWDWHTLHYKNLWTAKGIVRNLFYDGFRSVFPWTGFVFFGMWLGRLDLKNPAVNGRAFLGALGVICVAEGVSGLLLPYFQQNPAGMDAETALALFGTASMPPLPLFLMTGGATAVAVIAGCVRIGQAWPNAWLTRALAVTGQMALTWYVAHIVIGFGAIGALGLVNRESSQTAFACGIFFFIMAVGASWAWKRKFRHGPLEWVMRQVAG
jgi:uncharacterized membrane protein YeiB